MPQISIIVPVYKVEPYIRQCVNSILAQTFTDFELILVDDGSPDNCGAICDEYAEKDSRIHVIHQENGGASSARNAGIDWTFVNSDSKWIAFVDSDDWVHPNYLAFLYRAAQENNVKVSVCGFQRVKEKNAEIQLTDYQSTICPYEDFIFNVYLWNKLYAKELLSELRFPLGKSYEDEYVTYKLVSQHPKLALVKCDLYYYFYNSEGISKQPLSLKRMDIVEALAERLEFFRERGNQHVLPSCLQYYLWVIYDFGERLQSAERIPPEERVRCEKELKHMMRRAMIRFFPISLRRSCMKYYSFAFPGLIGLPYRVYRSLKKQ